MTLLALVVFQGIVLGVGRRNVVDTHTTKYLCGHPPDISICADSGPELSVYAQTTYVAVELKLGNSDDSARGQACGYSQSLRAVQLHRKKHVAVLSNLRENIVFEYSGKLRRGYRSVRFVDLLHYLRDEVLSNPMFFPLVSQFSYDLGRLENYLGRAYASQVASFRVPREVPNPENRVFHGKIPRNYKLMAVKRAINLRQDHLKSEMEVTLSTEIGFLVKLLKSRRGPPLNNHLQQILFHSRDNKELATLPVGSAPTDPLTAKGLTSGDMSTVLLDILDAIIWLHKHNIIHRDIRWDNIIVSNNRGYLIDLGCATTAGQPVTFAGGWICCPPELLAGGLNREAKYTPLFSHDFLSWMLMVNMGLFPERWNGVRTQSIVQGDTQHHNKFGGFWGGVGDNTFWGPYVKEAKKERANVKTLKRLPSVYYWIVGSELS